MQETSPSFPLWPEQASEWAAKADQLHIALTLHNVFFTLLVFALVATFTIVSRRRSESERPRQILGSKPLEVGFTLFGLFLWMGVFAWGSALYFEYARPPKNAMEVFVTGRQWMFHTQHPEGQREINELHVPIGQPVRLTMTSEDVIHSFFIPAFRIKRDVIPGRYTNLWFTPTKTGKYHLFCAEYCGTEHANMGGWIYVMEPAAYAAWLTGDTGGGMDSMASQGEKLFANSGCSSCHRLDMQGRCPNLANLYGSSVQLAGGAVATVDDAYIRESILNPGAKIHAGFQNIMPSYQGQLTEQDILKLIAYIRSLGGTQTGGTNVGAGGEAGGAGQNPPTSGDPGAGGSRGVRDNKSQDRGLTSRP
jgi:cytochrome c oxidase subunit 2